MSRLIIRQKKQVVDCLSCGESVSDECMSSGDNPAEADRCKKCLECLEEPKKDNHWGATAGVITICYNTEEYMEMNFDEWGYFDTLIDKREEEKPPITEEERQALIKKWKWENETERELDMAFTEFDDDIIEECDKNDDGAVAVYFRKKKSE
tara:strand:- start:5800 stop:6255 length:456 start_codon:yes stop_codon:yes gene_type:complete